MVDEPDEPEVLELDELDVLDVLDELDVLEEVLVEEVVVEEVVVEVLTKASNSDKILPAPATSVAKGVREPGLTTIEILASWLLKALELLLRFTLAKLPVVPEV